ncbi:MAG: tetratricopeptide repeat protein, partial [Alphaproteobacteria bacterium]|nr:tetratricopeptide repeat protein [Alphaproteobacteria bacterium]
MKDVFGNVVTTSRPETVAALDSYGRAFLSYGPELPEIIAAADADPGCGLVNAHAAIVHMAFEAARGHRAARPYL